MKAGERLLLKLRGFGKKKGAPKTSGAAIIDEIEARRGSLTVNAILDALSFKKLFFFWVVLLVFFGLGYYRFSSENSYLYQPMFGEKATSLADCVYFSFVTATTTGFGDIVPYGGFRSMAIAEVILALILLALVTSKIISVKQNVILGETYEISLNEQLYRLRSSFLLFRQHIERQISTIEDGKLNRREIAGLHLQMSLFEDALRESLSLFQRSKHKEFIKEIDPVNAELLAGSAMSSLGKIGELIKDLEKRKIDWRSDCNAVAVANVVQLSGKLIEIANIKDQAASDEMKGTYESVSSYIHSRSKTAAGKKALTC